MTKKESRRTKMTRKLLKTALIELMQEKPFKQITVKELCEKADLNRTTFYLHYNVQQDVLDDIEKEVIGQTAEYMKNVSPAADTVELIETFLLYVQKNETLFRILLAGDSNEDFQLEFIRHTLDTIHERLPVYGDSLSERYVLTFLMYGSIHIIIEWLESDFDISAREAAKLIYALCDSIRNRDFSIRTE